MAGADSLAGAAGIASIINEITSDPERMSKLRSVLAPDTAHGADGGGAQVAEAAPDNGIAAPGAEQRRRLIEALTPYLSEERRGKVNTLLMIMSLLESGGIGRAKGGE